MGREEALLSSHTQFQSFINTHSASECNFLLSLKRRVEWIRNEIWRVYGLDNQLSENSPLFHESDRRVDVRRFLACPVSSHHTYAHERQRENENEQRFVSNKWCVKRVIIQAAFIKQLIAREREREQEEELVKEETKRWKNKRGMEKKLTGGKKSMEVQKTVSMKDDFVCMCTHMPGYVRSKFKRANSLYLANVF